MPVLTDDEVGLGVLTDADVGLGKAEPLGPPEPPQYEPETVAPVLPPPRVEAPSPMGGMPLVFIPPETLTPEQATARRMAAPSTLLPSFPEKYGAGVAQGFPFVEELGPKVQETDPMWLAALKASANVGLSIPEFATSPLGALTQAAGPIAPRVTSAAFSIDMLGGALKQFPEVYAKWNTLSPARQAETAINLVSAVVMGGFLGVKAKKGWGKQPLGKPSPIQQQAVRFTAELAEKDPETFGQLAKEQVQKAVDVEQRQPTVPVVPVVTAPPEKEPAPAPTSEKALTAPAAGEIVPPVIEPYTISSRETRFGTRWQVNTPIYNKAGEVSYLTGPGLDGFKSEAEAVAEAQRRFGKPAAPAAQAKETYAPEERKVEEGVQPERVGTDAQRLPAEAGPSDSVRAAAEGPKAPEGTLPLTPPAVEAAKPAVPSTERIGGIYVMDRGRLREVTPEQASKLMSMIRDKTGKGASGLGPMRLYDVNGKQIGYVSYNGNVWLGKSQERGPSPARDELIYNATGLVKTPEGNWELPKPPYWEELTEVQDKLRALEEKHDYDPVTTAIEEPAYGPLVKQRDQILKGIYRPTTIEAETSKPTAPSTKAAKPFEVDEQLVMRSPHTGEDTLVSYRGKPESGQAVVWTGRSQMQVPESWLRRQGEKYEGQVQPATAAPSVVEVEKALPTAEGVREAIQPAARLSKEGLIEELIGKKPAQNLANVQLRVQWESDRKTYSKFTKPELVNRVNEQRRLQAERATINQALPAVTQEVQQVADAAGPSWRKALREYAASKEGLTMNPPADTTKAEAVAIYADAIAGTRVRRAARQPPPTPGAAAGGPIGTQGALAGAPTPTVPPAVSTLPPKAQSQIIRDLAKGLGLPIRFGRLRTRKYGGYFQKQANLIGAQLANRLPVVTHEVGHKLDAQFDISRDLSIRAELHVLGDPGTPGSMSSWTPSKPVKYKMGEGVAEFVRYWAIDPAEAQRLAPNTFTMFENILNANKDFGDVMRTVQKDIQLWRAADPQARLRSSISTSNPNKTPYTLSQLTRDLVNDLTFLRLAVDDAKHGATTPIAASLDPYIAARNLRGSFGMAMQFINKGVVDFKTKSVQLGTSLEDALKPVSGRIQDFRDWIVAKRAQELITQGRETGLDPSDVNTVAGRFDADPTFNAAFNAIKTWNDKVLQYAVDAGLVEQGTPATPTSPATGAFAIRQMNQDYVPFHRVFEVGAGETPSIESSGIGRGLNLGKPGSIRRLVGSTRDIIDPIESMIKNSYALVTASEKAAIHNSIAALADYPNMGKWLERVADPKEHLRLGLDKIRKQLEDAGADLSLVPDDLLLDFYRNSGQAPFGENIIRIKRNGQNEFYRLNKDLFDTFHALDIEDSGRLISLMGKQAQLLRAGVTLTPDFALMNALRDTFMSAIISKHNVFPFEATIRGLAALFNKPQLVAEWAASGGKQSIEANYFDRDALQKYMRQKITKELTPAERATIVLKSPLEALRWLTGTFEEATRIGEYQKAYNDYVRQGVPEGDARRMAAFEARDRQDFAKGGARTKVVRALTPFWNAALQGTIRFAQSVKERPVQTTLKGLAYITIPKLLEQALNYTDPSYDDRPQWERDLFFLIPYGKDQNGRTKFVRIPIPFEAGVVFATFPGRIIQWLKQNDPQALTSYFSTLLQQTVPNPIPPAIQTVFSDFLSGAKGWDIYRGRQIVPESIADMPPEFQWTEQTSLTAKKLGGILGFSPMKVDHIIQQSSGGLGKQLTYQVSDRALAAITGEKRPTISAMPGMRFVTTPAGSMSQAVETFYDNLSKVKGDHEASKKIKGYQPKYAQFYTAFARAADTMSDLRARARKTQDQVEKQKLSLQIAELARTMNAKFKGGSQPARTGTMPAGVPLPAPVPLPPMFQP